MAHRRRAAAVSTGTLLLCLWTTGTAFADSGTDPLTPTAASPVGSASTTRPPSRDPIDDLVRQVSETVGVSDPLTTEPDKPGHHHKHGRPGSGSPTDKPTATGSRTHAQRAAADHRSQPVLGLSRWRMSAGDPSVMPVAVRPPTIAHPQHRAGLVARARASLDSLLPGPSDLDHGRGLLLLVGTMVIGCLAAGHIKVAQEGLAALDLGAPRTAR
jgi:hypothetical protein